MTSQLDQLLAEHSSYEENLVDVDEALVKLVIFKLGEQGFAFLGANIAEVIPGDETVFYLPGMPATVEGVMNLRGDIESVIQLHQLLQLTEDMSKTKLATSTILLAKGKTMRSGLRVETLVDVVDVPESQLKPPPEALPEHLQPLVLGLLSFNDLAVTLLDVEAVFAAWLEGKG